MRRIIAALLAASAISISVANAADLPAKAPVYKAPVVAAPHNWTGFYIGVNGGYGWSDRTVDYTPNDAAILRWTCGVFTFYTCPPPASFNSNGAVAGGQIGYNWQLNTNWLVGVEADFDWSGIKGTGISNSITGPAGPPGTPTTFVTDESVKYFGTVRGRLGFIPTAPLLIYATGGLAYGKVTENSVMNESTGGFGATFGGFGFLCVAGPNCFVGSSSKVLTGWTVGAGGEYMITDHVTLKAEYLYVDLGNMDSFNAVATNSSSAPNPSSFSVNTSSVRFSVVRAGLNWKF